MTMPFEGQGSDGSATSPGGFSFGVQGFQYGEPRPCAITFFLDGSAMVTDQYGRPIRRAVTPEGLELRFADAAPDAHEDGAIVPRPQFATHKQTLDALAAERIDWLAYSVTYKDRSGQRRVLTGLQHKQAHERKAKLSADGNTSVVVARSIACAGWPQLPYDDLRKMPELPTTPVEELLKIRDPMLRKDALRALGLEADSEHAAPPRQLPPGIKRMVEAGVK